MLRLRAFGPLEIEDGEGVSVARLLAQPKRAALLAYLTLAQPGTLHRRDTVLALFWPDFDEQRGRHALSQALTFLRRWCEEGSVVTRGNDEIGIAAGRVQCDVVDFHAAVAAEEWGRALELYRGHLLEGLHVTGAAPFVDWVDRERERLRELGADAAWRQARVLLAEGRLVEAERAAERALALVPTEESPVREFVGALCAAGDRGAALRFFEKFEGRFARELGIGPAPETVAMAEAVRRGDFPGPEIVDATSWEEPSAGPSRTPAPTPEDAHVQGLPSREETPGAAAAVPPPPELQRRGRVSGRVAGLVSAVVAAVALSATAALRLQDGRAGGAGTLLGEGLLARFDTVVVADFTYAPDPLLGAAVAEWVRAELDQSDLFRTLSPTALGVALRRMGRPPEATLGASTAREMAVRNGYPVVVTGEVGAVGDGFVVTARLEGCEGQVYRRSTTAASSPDALPDALRRLGGDLRAYLGDSRRSIRTSPPLERVTTASLPALRLYTEAVRLRDVEGRAWEAIPLLEEAIALDTAFATAYRKLGLTLNNLGVRSDRWRELSAKAYAHRDRLGDFERMEVERDHLFWQDIHGHDAEDPGPDECALFDRQLRILDAYVRRHPDDPRPWNDYGVYLARMGRKREAIVAYQRSVEAMPGHGLSWSNLFHTLWREGQKDSARAVQSSWRAALGETPGWILAQVSLAGAEHRYDEADSLLAVHLRAAGRTAGALVARAELDAVRGLMDQARTHFAEALELVPAESGGVPHIVERGLVELVAVGDTAAALRDATLAAGAIEEPEAGSTWTINVGLLSALSGDTTGARAVLRTLVEHGHQPMYLVRGNLTAAIRLAEGHPRESLSVLASSAMPCWGNPGFDLRGDPRWRRILAGRAYEALALPDSAAIQYEAYLTDPSGSVFGVEMDAIFLVDTLERLGTLLPRLGRPQEGAAHLREAARLWRHADPVLQPRVRAFGRRAALLEESAPR